MLNRTTRVAILLIAGLFNVGCAEPVNNASQVNGKPMQNTENSAEQVQSKWRLVTVKKFSFEGGFFGLESSAGEKLLPMNLPTEYLVDGTQLKVQGDFIEGMMTIHQWGKPFKISNVELVSLGKATSTNAK